MHKYLVIPLFLLFAGTTCAAPLVVGYERLLEKDGQPTAMQGRVLMKALQCMQCHGEGEKKAARTETIAWRQIKIAAQQGAPELIEKGDKLFHRVGCVACHSPQHASANNTHTVTDDPFAEIEQQVIEVVVPHIPSIPLSQERLNKHNNIRNLMLTEEEVDAISAYLLTLDAFHEEDITPRRDIGKVVGQSTVEPPKQLRKLSAGCMSEEPQTGVPWYGLNAKQREAIQLALAEPEAPDTRTEILETLAELNCFACHERDGYGGIEDGRRPYFSVTLDAELGDEGRIPPTLTGVGAKLTAKGLHEIMVEGKTVRPYMATRMPKFDEGRMATLAKQFKEVDTLPKKLPMDVTGLLHHHRNRYGRELMGTEGLSCISCHGLQGEKSLGIPAIDLALTTERLEPGWFMAYMLDPPSLRPGTRMPSFFEGNKSTFTKLFGGNAVQQVEALWIYLRELDQTRLPVGMEGDEDYTLVPTDRPIVLRTFMKNVGTHAIAVGYPEGIHIAFDALNVRLAMAWRGAFIDAESTWANRFSPFAEPLGEDVHELMVGMPFAVLDNADAPWPDTVGKDAGYRFKGYTLDEKKVPTFHYTITAGNQVIPVDEKISIHKQGIRRRFSFPNGVGAGFAFRSDSSALYINGMVAASGDSWFWLDTIENMETVEVYISW